MEKIRLRACTLIIENDAILLVEFKNDNNDGVHYNLPAGGLEPGETLIEAAQREAKEEACVEVEVGSVKIQTLTRLVSNGSLFRNYIPFNYIQRLIRILLITIVVKITAIMLRNMKFN